MSTSEKDKDDNTKYINSNWFPRIIGHAFNSLKGKLKEGDKLVITKSKFTRESYKDAEGVTKSSFKFLILEAAIDEEKTDADAHTTESATQVEENVVEAKEDCPW